MAITVDQANIGTLTADAASTSLVLTTTQAVSSGGFIVLTCGGSGTDTTIVSVSGGGLTWSVDKEANGSSRSIAIVSAQAPSGLASSTNITITWADSPDGRFAGAASFLGVATSSPVDGTPLGGTDVATAAWDTGNYSMQAGSLLVGADYTPVAFSANHVATAGTEAFEAADFGDSYGGVLVYRIEASAGSYNCAGTHASAGANKNIAVAYLAASGGPPQTLRPDADVTTTGWSTAPLWSKIEESSADGTVITATAS